MNRIRRLAIVGGIHGNELTGAYLVKKFEQFPHLVHRPSFEILTLLGNLKALAATRRYLEKDLNRCFRLQDLQDPTLTSYEDLRAKEIYQTLVPAGQPLVDLLVDVHSTTANMGLTLILGHHHPFLLQLAAYLSMINPWVRVYSSIRSGREYDSLRSLCPLSLVLEVGPVAQGVLEAGMFQKTAALIDELLNYLEHYNQGTLPACPSSLTCYQYLKVVDYPRNPEGEIQAMIHPQLQYRDYEPLHPGDPMFLTFTDEVIRYQAPTTVYPVFINEAAYYEKGIAMCFTAKQCLTLEPNQLT